jgi:hypothetical protein
MARTRCPYTEEGLKRVLRAVVAAGVAARIEIEKDGKITVLPAGGQNVEPPITSVPARRIVL